MVLSMVVFHGTVARTTGEGECLYTKQMLHFTTYMNIFNLKYKYTFTQHKNDSMLFT